VSTLDRPGGMAGPHAVHYTPVTPHTYSRCNRSVKPNTHRRRRRDSTVELSRVGGVYWALYV